MPKDITITIYTFKELLELAEKSDSGKDGRRAKDAADRAREWLREGLHLWDWWEDTYHTWEDALAQIGFTDAQISFSGFSSQGDGASFTCKRVDMEKFIPFLTNPPEPEDVIKGTDNGGEDFRPWLVHKAGGVIKLPPWGSGIPFDELHADIRSISSRYSHKYACTWSLDDQDPDGNGSQSGKRAEIIGQIDLAAERLRLDLCDAIYKQLEEEYEYRTADEQLIEDAEANEWTFDVSGRREG